MSLIEGLEDVKIARDMSMREYLTTNGVTEEGLAFADVRYAQTAALSLDQLGLRASQLEVREISLT